MEGRKERKNGEQAKRKEKFKQTGKKERNPSRYKRKKVRKANRKERSYISQSEMSIFPTKSWGEKNLNRNVCEQKQPSS